MTVTELTELRKTARETGVYLRVVKNTLARRAVAGTELECMQSGLVGPLLLAFSMEDPGSAGRLIHNFAKTHDKLVTKVVAIGGQAYGPAELDRLASLPTRDQGIAMLMSVMKAPVGKLARTLAARQRPERSGISLINPFKHKFLEVNYKWQYQKKTSWKRSRT